MCYAKCRNVNTLTYTFTFNSISLVVSGCDTLRLESRHLLQVVYMALNIIYDAVDVKKLEVFSF